MLHWLSFRRQSAGIRGLVAPALGLGLLTVMLVLMMLMGDWQGSSVLQRPAYAFKREDHVVPFLVRMRVPLNVVYLYAFQQHSQGV